MIPALEAVIKYGGQFGVEEIVFGMAHRGRLNVLANVMGKPYRAIFNEFAGGATNPGRRRRLGRRQISPRHLVATASSTAIKVHLSLLPNPSHLEAVDPVVLGKARAVQTIKGDKRRRHGAADPAPRRRGLRRPGHRRGMPRLLRPARLRHRRLASTSSSTTRSASPPARSSRARRPTRRTSPRASRRRSSTSTATIPKRSPSAASWRSSSASASTATSSSTCGAIAASATTKATSRASPSR